MRALLLSGGMDSAALAWREKPEVGVFVNYGQVTSTAESHAALMIGSIIGCKMEKIEIDCSGLGSGDLASTDSLDIAPTPEWWPFRNQLISTIAAARCVVLGVSELMIGTVRDDNLNLDGTLDFVRKMDELLSMQEGGVRFLAPAIDLTSEELILSSSIPKEMLCWAHSCTVSNTPCLRCRSCLKNLRILDKIGVR